MDLKPVINCLKKNPSTSQYYKMFDYIQSIYTEFYDLFETNINSVKNFFRKESRLNYSYSDNEDNSINVINTLWLEMVIQQNLEVIEKISQENKEVIRVYYKNPELMIINYLLFNSWRNSMYIDTELNLSRVDKSRTSFTDRDRKRQNDLKKYNDFIEVSRKKINKDFWNVYTYLYFANKPSIMTDYTNVWNGMLDIWPSSAYVIENSDLTNYKNSPFFGGKKEIVTLTKNELVVTMNIIICISFIAFSVWLFKKQLIK